MKKKINMMSEIAEKYGLELDKPFWIFSEEEESLNQYQNKKYHFTKDGMRDQDARGGYESVLRAILSGEYFVEKVPEFAEPIWCKKGDLFKFVRIGGGISQENFDETTRDCLLRKVGNMFSVEDTIPKVQIVQLIKMMKEGIL